MTKIMLIGDYFHALADIEALLSRRHEIYPIAFMDHEVLRDSDRSKIPGQWHQIDFRDFHELTIRIMEFEPEVVIYLSFYLRSSRVNRSPDLAEIALPETFEHLRETIAIHNSHLIILGKIPKSQGRTGLQMNRLFQEGLEMIQGMSKLTILLMGEIVDSSAFGFASWYKNNTSYLPDNLGLVWLNSVYSKIELVIHKADYGTFELEDQIREEELEQFVSENLQNVEFRGEDEEFSLYHK